jgi:hypothetical protein
MGKPTYAPRYDVSVVRTLSAAMGTSPNKHDYAITDTDTGRVKGTYANELLAFEAMERLAGTRGLFVLTVLHPATCRCPDVP